MFHYRLTISDKGFRIFVAACVAIAAHIALITLDIDRKSSFAPSISLPRSVNVFLGQNSIPERTEHVPEKEKKHVKTNTRIHVVETKEDFINKEVSVNKPESSIQQPVEIKESLKLVTEPADKKKQINAEQVDALPRTSNNGLKTSSAQTEREMFSQQKEAKPEPSSGGENEGVQHPGVLQVAYPRYQVNASPTYPGLARKRGQEGTVILQVLVNRDGRVDDLKIDISSGFGLLDRAAITAVNKWLFEPGRKGDVKVSMWVRVPVTFKLKQ